MVGSQTQIRRAKKGRSKLSACALCEGFLAERPELRVPYATETAECYYGVSTHTTWYGRLLHDQALVWERKRGDRGVGAPRRGVSVRSQVSGCRKEPRPDEDDPDPDHWPLPTG